MPPPLTTGTCSKTLRSRCATGATAQATDPGYAIPLLTPCSGRPFRCITPAHPEGHSRVGESRPSHPVVRPRCLYRQCSHARHTLRRVRPASDHGTDHPSFTGDPTRPFPRSPRSREPTRSSPGGSVASLLASPSRIAPPWSPAFGDHLLPARRRNPSRYADEDLETRGGSLGDFANASACPGPLPSPRDGHPLANWTFAAWAWLCSCRR